MTAAVLFTNPSDSGALAGKSTNNSSSQMFSTPAYDDFNQHSDLYLNGQPLRFPQRLLVNPNNYSSSSNQSQNSGGSAQQQQQQQPVGNIRRVRPVAVPPPPGFDLHSSAGDASFETAAATQFGSQVLLYTY